MLLPTPPAGASWTSLQNEARSTVSQLAGEFPDLVASGISKHLMGLRATGLVTSQRVGRQQHYRLEGETLASMLAPWMARYES